MTDDQAKKLRAAIRGALDREALREHLDRKPPPDRIEWPHQPWRRWYDPTTGAYLGNLGGPIDKNGGGR